MTEWIRYQNPPTVLASSSIVGKKEHDGPLGAKFDLHDEKDKFGQPTWEQAESEMQRLALNVAMKRGNLDENDIDVLFAGDLINQCTGSAYGLLDYRIPYFGLYGACSTAAESLILTSLLIDGGYARCGAAVTSSHNLSAERQFRYPVEYGGQRAPTAQWTVTGAAAFLLAHEGAGPYVTEAMPGISVDPGISDINNMGAAMAPAVVDTLTRYFSASGHTPDDFDLIVTGDLGYEGYSIVLDLMKEKGYDLTRNYNDCGLMIYDRKAQDMHAGGSGCGCSAVVLAAELLPLLREGTLRRMLFIGTGALMSPMSQLQGKNIPSIAHLVCLSHEKEGCLS